MEKKMLEGYQEPAIEPAMREELESFVARRKESMSDALY